MTRITTKFNSGDQNCELLFCSLVKDQNVPNSWASYKMCACVGGVEVEGVRSFKVTKAVGTINSLKLPTTPLPLQKTGNSQNPL
jgi:hypothetical protein